MFPCNRTHIALFAIAASCFVNFNATAEETTKEIATFGGGCYWCVEAVFQRIEGVESVSPGFMGGRIKDPTYHQVLTGRTGHAEVVQIEYDPKIVSYDMLLQVFFLHSRSDDEESTGPRHWDTVPKRGFLSH